MAANFIDLTTVAAVNNLLAQASGTDSTLIQTEITNLSRYILTKTDRSYLGGFLTFNDAYNGNGACEMLLRQYPLLAVASLLIDGTSVPQSLSPTQAGWVIDTSGSGAGLALRSGGGQTAGFNRWGYQPTYFGGYGNAPPLGQHALRFCEGFQNVVISYTAGMVTDQRHEQQTVPSVSPYTVTAAQAATFWQDLGLTTTAGVPVIGYTVAAGIYTVPLSYSGQALLLNYQYGAIPQDLNECATKVVATYYRRPKWLDQTSQMQPGVGTTAFSRSEWAPECMSILQRYKRVFQD